MFFKWREKRRVIRNRIIKYDSVKDLISFHPSAEIKPVNTN